MQDVIPVIRENAIKAYRGANEEGKQLLSNLLGKQHFYRDPKEWVKTKEDICEAAGISRNIWPVDIAEREKLIMKVFNRLPDGTEWKPNWADPSQKKWRIWVNTHKDDSSPLGFRLSFFVADCGLVVTCLGCRLYFKDQDTAIYVGKNLLHLLTDSIIY